MSVLRLQSSTWEAEVGISKSRRLVWATEQNPVSKCQKQTNKQTNWRLDSNDQIVRIHLQVLCPLSYLLSPGKTRIFLIQSRLDSREVPSLLNRILEDLEGDLARGDEDPGSLVWSKRRDNWASTFLFCCRSSAL